MTVICWHCQQETTRDHALRIAENKFRLTWENWNGWRFSGRYLIAPGKAGRITPERLIGILWEEDARSRIRRSPKKMSPEINGLQAKNFQGSRQVISLPARERFDGQA